MSAELSSSCVQGLWIGGRLSNIEKLCITSYLAHGHQFHLYTYGEVEGVPPGTTICDANEILPSSMIFLYREHKSYAGFSNYFRYKLLLDRGGWWSDLDMVCLRPFFDDREFVFASQQENILLETATSDNDLLETVTSGIIRAPKSSSLMKNLFDSCLAKDPTQIKWGETGPRLLHAAVEQYGLQESITKAVTFCPIPYFRWFELVLPRANYEFPEGVYAVHLWNEMWRRFDADKDEVYTASSIFERLKARYLIG